MIGPRQSGSATCKLVVSIALPVKMRSQVRELTALSTPAADQRKGYASQLLHDVCKEADAQNITLFLAVAEEDKQRLCAWYTRFGFQPIQAKPTLMARMPGSTPRVLQPIARAVTNYH